MGRLTDNSVMSSPSWQHLSNDSTYSIIFMIVSKQHGMLLSRKGWLTQDCIVCAHNIIAERLNPWCVLASSPRFMHVGLLLLSSIILSCCSGVVVCVCWKEHQLANYYIILYASHPFPLTHIDRLQNVVVCWFRNEKSLAGVVWIRRPLRWWINRFVYRILNRVSFSSHPSTHSDDWRLCHLFFARPLTMTKSKSSSIHICGVRWRPTHVSHVDIHSRWSSHTALPLYYGAAAQTYQYNTFANVCYALLLRW